MKIIGEISGNHRHEFEHTKKLILQAKLGGFTHVKFQTIIPEEITVPLKVDQFRISDPASPWNGRYLIDLYEETAMSFDLQSKLIAYCKSIDFKWFSSPFSISCVEFLEHHDCPIYKIASFEASDKILLERIAKTGKPIIMSTGGLSEDQIDQSLSYLRQNTDAYVELLYCVSEYPASVKKFNLGKLERWSRLFGAEVGLSDHSEGCAVAPIFVSHGAKSIEKHIKLEGDFESIDADFSLPSNYFRKFTGAINDAHCLTEIKSQDDDSKIGQKYHRSYYYADNLLEGVKLERKHLISLRPSSGVTTFEAEKFFGLKLKRSVFRYDSLTENDFEKHN